MAKPKPEKRFLTVKRMDSAALETMKRAAGARGMTHAEYLEALVELHQRVRGIEDPRVTKILRELKLAEVTL